MSAIFSGILAALCFPKASLGFLAWIAFIPLLLGIKRGGGRAAFRLGFIFGLVFFGINLFWINALNAYAPVVSTLGWMALVIGEAAILGVACYLIKYLDEKIPSLYIFSAPLTWVFFEWLRTLGPFGISAGTIGYSQVSNLPLIQIASFSSVLGVSFLIIFTNACLTMSFTEKSRKGLTYLLLALALPSLAYYWGKNFLDQIKTEEGKELTISIIQGNIPQRKKLNVRYNREIANIHEDLGRSIFDQKPDIIIWPETTILTYLMNDPYYLDRIKKLAQDSKTYLIIGSPHYDENQNIYNSILVFSPTGEVISRYDKQRLVPFGEYLPLRPVFYPFLKFTNLFYEDFDMSHTSHLLDLGFVKFGGVICFESTFTDLFRDQVARGADILLTVTNDAWFGDSTAPYEHLDNGIFRAIENRKYFIQAANTGISAVIDPYGRILAKTKVGEATALTFKVPLP